MGSLDSWCHNPQLWAATGSCCAISHEGPRELESQGVEASAEIGKTVRGCLPARYAALLPRRLRSPAPQRWRSALRVAPRLRAASAARRVNGVLCRDNSSEAP